MRSYNGRWGVMEQQPGQVNWGPVNPRPWPGSTRLWLWTAIAHGAELLDTYRYRQPLSGSEQYHAGLMASDGTTLTQGGADFVTVAQEIERTLGKPVISSNLATIWHCLRLAGYDERIHGFGRLFEMR